MEISIIKFLQSASNPFYDFIFIFVSELASYKGFLITFAIFFILLIVKMKKKKNSTSFCLFTLSFGVTYGLSVLINTLLKALINRPRPYEVDMSIIDMLHASGQSMPSGHTLSATIICAFIFFSVYYYSKNRALKISLASVLALFLVLVGISRMYLGQHFISDVIVGFFLALAFSVLGIYLFTILDKRFAYDNNRKNNKEENKGENSYKKGN